MEKTMNTCSEHGLCSNLDEFIETEEGKPGFHVWKKVEGGKLVMKGVFFQPKKSGKRSIMLNRCPWCEAELKWGLQPKDGSTAKQNGGDV